MFLYFKFILLVVLICNLSAVYTMVLPLEAIYKLRVKKIKKIRQFYGKKFITKKLGGDSNLLANNVADMASRLACDSKIQKIMRKTLKEKTNPISFACEVKYREK